MHGIADDSSIWAGTVAALSADCACTAIDLPGHGRSPTPTEPSAYEREALLASIDEVLDGTGPRRCTSDTPSAATWDWPTASPGPESSGAWCWWPPDQDSVTRPRCRTGTIGVHLSAPRLDVPQVATTASLHTDSMVIDRLAEVTVPVGLLVGSQDKAFFGANDYMERKLPDVRRRTIPDGRHRLMRTHAAEVAEMVHEVLAAADLRGGR